MVNLIFYFPRKNIGGVQTLFVRLANEIAKYNKVYIVDYIDGYLAKSVNDSVGLIEYKETLEAEIPDNSVLICPADMIYQELSKIQIPLNTKLFFWNLHPLNLSEGFIKRDNTFTRNKYIKRILNKLVKPSREIITSALENKALYHMDGANINSSMSITGLDGFLLLPLYFKPTVGNSYVVSVEKKTLNLVWLGRLELGFKTIILIKLINDVNELMFDVTVNINIIGSGNGEKMLRKLGDSLSNVNLIFKGIKEGKALDEELLSADIAVAMGTSALYTANLGIPTVCLDFSFTQVPQEYKYRWIFETKDYSLGYAVSSDPLSIPSENTHELQSLFLTSRSELGKYSVLCKDYVDNNYCLSIGEYIELFNGTQLCYSQLMATQLTYRKSLLYKLRKMKTFISVS